MTVRILTGDARRVLETLPSCSVQAIVTSPPYWNLRSYLPDEHPDKPKEIGLEDSVDAWVAELVVVFREARRVLSDDGVAWINLGDSYAGSWGAQSRATEHASPVSATQINAAPKKSNTGSLSRTPGLKPKDLIGQPWRVAFALQADGWWWRDTIVWHKPNPMPESITDRCTKAWEPVLMMTKAARYYFDAEAIKEPASENTHARYKSPDGWDTSKGDGGHGSFHKGGREKGRKAAPDGSGTKTNASFDAAMAVMPERRNKRNVWTIASEPFKESHFATFPTALVEPCILASTRTGDTVLDPFFGAGTTGLVADRLQRNAIGIELNPAYSEISRKRIHGDAPLFAEVEA